MKPAKKKSHGLPYDPYDPSITDIYANDAFIAVNASDVVVTFGIQLHDAGGELNMKPTTRVHFTHDTFLLLSELFLSRANMLRNIYGDKPPSFRAVEKSVVDAAYAELAHVIEAEEP